MYMIDSNFQLHHLKLIFFADLPNQLSRSFLNLFPLKYLLPVFRTPYQMVTCIIDRMTRSFNRHAWFISHLDARAYKDKGNDPLPPITPLVRHSFIPAASRGDDYKNFTKINQASIFKELIFSSLQLYGTQVIQLRPLGYAAAFFQETCGIVTGKKVIVHITRSFFHIGRCDHLLFLTIGFFSPSFSYSSIFWFSK